MMCICCFATWEQQGKGRFAGLNLQPLPRHLIRLPPASFSNLEIWRVTSAIASDSVSFEAEAR